MFESERVWAVSPRSGTAVVEFIFVRKYEADGYTCYERRSVFTLRLTSGDVLDVARNQFEFALGDLRSFDDALRTNAQSAAAQFVAEAKFLELHDRKYEGEEVAPPFGP
ncbi:hypothetical protein [Rhodanobacter denitrificans]|uniref:hypothetical protein n=1 Tax=Rhodanobacter denitrificans TaxID=666685 RepID=UPI0011C05BB5|nr:hypothetical protein [Rhodanobacter denitrificans]